MPRHDRRGRDGERPRLVRRHDRLRETSRCTNSDCRADGALDFAGLAAGGSADRGSAGVWVLALSGVLLLAGAASVLAGLAIISRHEAGTAADLAALAAASQVLSGSEVACASAAVIAEANAATLESCNLAAEGVVDVTVSVSVELGSLGIGVARATARAGPAAVGEVPLPGPGDP